MSPTLVGAFRGVVLAVVTAAIAAVVEVLGSGEVVPTEVWWVPVALAALRTLEGRVDKWLGQAPQAGLLGAGPENPRAYLVLDERGGIDARYALRVAAATMFALVVLITISTQR